MPLCAINKINLFTDLLGSLDFLEVRKNWSATITLVRLKCKFYLDESNVLRLKNKSPTQLLKNTALFWHNRKWPEGKKKFWVAVSDQGPKQRLMNKPPAFFFFILSFLFYFLSPFFFNIDKSRGKTWQKVQTYGLFGFIVHLLASSYYFFLKLSPVECV